MIYAIMRQAQRSKKYESSRNRPAEPEGDIMAYNAFDTTPVGAVTTGEPAQNVYDIQMEATLEMMIFGAAG